MDALIRELELMRETPGLSNAKLIGGIVAAAVRMRAILDARMVGIQSLATAVAMQPEINASKLHDDFIVLLKANFESLREAPSELRDMAAAIKLAASDRGQDSGVV
jgi:hypothetical protein